MSIEVPVEPDLDNLDFLRSRFQAHADSMGVSGPVLDEICSAMARAFSAVCLAETQGRPVVVGLKHLDGEIRLHLRFSPPEGGGPAGLGAPLFCPPARRVSFSSEHDKAVWSAFWEDKP